MYLFKNQWQTASIYLYGDIGPGGITSQQVVDDLRSLGERVQTIDVHINSGGGTVFDGFAIFNLFKQHKATIRVFVDGMALSVASVIAMAADKGELEIAANAFMMVHDVTGSVWGGNASEFQRQAELLEKISETVIATYAARTGLSETRIRDMVDAETWMTAKEAVALGFADRIGTPLELAASFDLKRFRAPADFVQKLEAGQEERDNSAVAAFEALVARFQSRGLPRSAATREAIRCNPTLHQQWLAAVQRNRAHARSFSRL